MKKIAVLLFCILSFCSYGQFHLIWTNPNKDFSFLDKEKNLKVAFDMDSLRIEFASLEKKGMDTREFQTEFTETVISNFITYFNKVKKKKIMVDKYPETYRYILKITPLRFYGTQIYWSADRNQPYSYYSIYFKGDYRVELYNTLDTVPLRSFKVSNLTNPHPKCSYYEYPSRKAKGPYFRSMTYESVIAISAKRAGIETAKYLVKSLRKFKL